MKARLIQYYWKDTPEIIQYSWVVETGVVEETFGMNDEEYEQYYMEISKRVGLEDDDVLFYQDEWDAEKVCDGDVKVLQVLKEQDEDEDVVCNMNKEDGYRFKEEK